MKSLRSEGCEDYVQYCVWFRGDCLDGPLVEPVELSDDHAASTSARELALCE